MPPCNKAKKEAADEDSGHEGPSASAKKPDPKFTKTDPYYRGLDTALKNMMPKSLKYDDNRRVLPLKQ